MLRRNLYNSDSLHLKKDYRKTFPKLIDIAQNSSSSGLFKENMYAFFSEKLRRATTDTHLHAIQRVLRLIEFDGQVVNELSTGSELPIHTLTYLWQFLQNELSDSLSPDLFIDLYSCWSPAFFRKRSIQTGR